MWVYTVTELNEIHARDVDSQKEMEKIIMESDWVWIDIMQPDEKEFEIIRNFIKESSVVEKMKEEKDIPRPEKVNDFVQKLCRHTKVPVEFRDERLTTVLAKRLMRAANTKKTKRKAEDDAIAAALILQGYLDEVSNNV